MSNHKTFPMGAAIVLLALLFTLISSSPVCAASSVNVSLERALYSDMEFWAAEGLIESQLNSFRPFAGSEVGSQIAAALDRCDAKKSASPTCRRIAGHYAKLFQGDVEEARFPDHRNNTFLKPVETFSLSYRYLDGPFSVYNQEGLHYSDGHNAMIQFQSQARLWRAFSFFVQPMVLYNQKSGFHSIQPNPNPSSAPPNGWSDDESSNFDVRLHKGYGKLTLSNVELLVGRDSLWWGPAYHGALLMSNNAHPFDMVKLSNPEPVLLPWIFSYLGPVQFNLIFSELKDDREGEQLKNPFLYGGRLGFKPHPCLELGASHLVMFSGKGRRDLSFSDVFNILYGNENQDNKKTDSNQEFSVDAALTIPNVKKYLLLADGLKLYVEWGGEDTGLPPDRRAYVTGLALYKLFDLERTALHVEYARMSPSSVPGSWYNHPYYPMYYKDSVFGHHAGSDADDLFIEWSQDFEKFYYKLGFDRERSGIQTRDHTQTKNQFFGEVGYRLNDHSDIRLSYAYEKVDHVDYEEDDSRNNHFLGIEAFFSF